MDPQAIADVIVLGGGPVGAAIARGAQGVRAVLIARNAHACRPRAPGAFDARVYALSPGNLEFLESIGAAPAERTAVHAMRVFGDEQGVIEFDAYRAGVPALAWIVEDGVLQDALWAGLGALAPAEPERIEVHDREAAVILADGQRRLARLVVGADGARSFVRAQARIEASDRSYAQSAVVANFACQRAHENVAYQWFQGGSVLALLPLPAHHASMVWSLPSAIAESLLGKPAEDFCREVRAATRGLLGELHLIGTPRAYALRRLAAHRLVAPRIALAGDAAHVIHPLAGQGLNLGLQDARALIRVLAEREPRRDPGELALLRRYERARAEPVLAMDAMVDGLYALFSAKDRWAAHLRNAGLNLTDRLPVVKNLLMRHAMH